MKALAAAFAFAAVLCPAHAALVVSTAPTSNVTCSAGVCSAAAADAVLNVKDLRHLLAAGDVTVASGSVAQDIDFAAKLQWTRNSRLTLDAYRGIAVSLDITSEGSGGVTLTTDDGGSGGELVFTGKGKISFWDTASSLTINGKGYTLVASISALASAVQRNSHGLFALSRFYDASADGAYANAAVTKPFHGIFEGLGHTIENLTITAGARKNGFFNAVVAGGIVRDLTFEHPVMTSQQAGFVGVLAGTNQGTLSHVGVVDAVVTAQGAHGGLLVGHNDKGTIAWCSASGSISALGGRFPYAGGLAGWNTGMVTHSAANADVGSVVAGGLVASNQGLIVFSSAAGQVSGEQFSGGLAGTNDSGGTIDQSFATGAVYGVDGEEHVKASAAGVTAINEGMITNSYFTGSVTSGKKDSSGGFAVDSTEGTIATSYSSGTNLVSGEPGYGFIDEDGNSTNDYWDTDASGSTTGCKGTCTGVTGLTTAQLQSGLPAGFDPAIWAQSPGVNDGYPYLIANPPQ
jgi:hypothetical protein